MYLFDFLNRLFRKSNIPMIFYLVVNVLIIALGIKVVLTLIVIAGGVTVEGAAAVQSTTEQSTAAVRDTTPADPAATIAEGAVTTAVATVNGMGAIARTPIFQKLMKAEFLTCLLGGLLIYIICLFVALSPVGEFFVRWQTGCKKIRDKETREFLEPLFEEVHGRARSLDPSIPKNVRLYMNEDAAPNAFATGRKTICVTRGMLERPREQIMATLAHEFGHLAHKDTDMILVVRVGNGMINLLIIAVTILVEIFSAVAGLFAKIFSTTVGAATGMVVLGKILSFIFTTPFKIVRWLLEFLIIRVFFGIWTQIGFWLIQLSSRGKEYDADEFSFDCGYGRALCELLEYFAGNKVKIKRGLFAALARSHPDSRKRIERLQQLEEKKRSKA